MTNIRTNKGIFTMMLAVVMMIAAGFSLMGGMGAASAAYEVVKYNANSLNRFTFSFYNCIISDSGHEERDDAIDVTFDGVIENNVITLSNLSTSLSITNIEITLEVEGGGSTYSFNKTLGSATINYNNLDVDFVSGRTYKLLIAINEAWINNYCDEHGNCSFWGDKRAEINFTYYNLSVPQVELPPDPTKNGYNFERWYFDSAFTIPYNGELIFADTVLYAKFTPIDYSITYTLNGGGGVSNGTYNIEVATTLPTPSRNGYTFDGWYTNSGFTGSSVTNIPKGSTGNKAFYAKWAVVNYDISYILNGGTMNGQATKYTVETNNYTLPTPEKSGYTFGGWYTNAELTGNSVTSIPKGSTGNKAFYAKWNIVTYTIAYNTNEGEVEGAQTHYTVEDESITLAIPTRTGYNFMGWRNTSTGTIVSTIPKGSTGNKTLKAEWEIIRFTVSFIVEDDEYYSVEVDYGSVLVENSQLAQFLDVFSVSMSDEELDVFLSQLAMSDLVLVGKPTENLQEWINIYLHFMEFGWWYVGIIGGVIIAAAVLLGVRKAKKAG